ncbi:MAG: fumarate/nitrate reduction transcriptional regulator Fnr [Comamonadaceae bacterium]|nr:MAG: fumarate/nitrate reduction transcriptional regulator Fnr [Comamonadaceae bacterium]
MTSALLQTHVQPLRMAPKLAVVQGTSTPPVTALETRCSSCHLRELCLPCGLGDADIDRIDGLMFGRRRVKMGQTMYRAGDAFRFIYAVRMGTFKSELTLADGRDQVSGFHMGGELMGLDGIANGRHASSAVALEDAEVCAIPYAQLCDASAASAELQHAVSRLMSREIVREHSLMMLLGSMNAEERLAAFLLNLSIRLKARGYSPTEFHLRMSREEIGSYLGLKLETVSRTFSAFQKRRLLDVDKRFIRIIDAQALAQAFEMRVH